jgi:hypothetical protein
VLDLAEKRWSHPAGAEWVPWVAGMMSELPFPVTMGGEVTFMRPCMFHS